MAPRVCRAPSFSEINAMLFADGRLEFEDGNKCAGDWLPGPTWTINEKEFIAAVWILLLQEIPLIHWLACSLMDREMADCIVDLIETPLPFRLCDFGAVGALGVQDAGDAINVNSYIGPPEPAEWHRIWFTQWQAAAQSGDELTQLCILIDVAGGMLHEMVHLCDECDRGDSNCKWGTKEEIVPGTTATKNDGSCSCTWTQLFSNSFRYMVIQTHYPCLMLDSCCATFGCDETWMHSGINYACNPEEDWSDCTPGDIPGLPR